jgi:putative phage-type endonuclease
MIQGSNEWLDFRKDKIGGSDIPSILNVEGCYQSRSALLREKLGEKKEISEYTQAIFDKGHEFEHLMRGDFVPEVCVSKENDRFIASLDGRKGDLMLEVKNTNRMDYLDLARRGFVPPIYNAQIQWCLFVTELKECKLIVGNIHEQHEVSVFRDDEFINVAKIEATKFLKEMDASKTSQHTLLPAWRRILELKKMEIEMKKQLEEVSDEIKKLGEGIIIEFNATQLSGDGLRVEYITRKGSVDYGAIPELIGVDLDKYRKEGSTYVQVKLI